MNSAVEIRPGLLEALEQVAEREGVTPTSLVEEAVRRLLDERVGRQQPFRLRDASFGKGGLLSEFQDAPWEVVRAPIYEEPGP